MRDESITLPVAARRDYVRERYLIDGKDAVARALGVSPKAVKNMAWRLGLLAPVQHWSPEEDAAIRAAYSGEAVPWGVLNQLADGLGRTRVAVAHRVLRLGLSRPGAPHLSEAAKAEKRSAHREAQREYDRRRTRVYPSKARYTAEERLRLNSERMKRMLAERGHPRGFQGKRHSEEARKRVSAASKRAWANPSSALNSEAERQRRSDIAVQRQKDGVFLSAERAYTRSAGGRREDLGGRYFRSAWEANYARYLNLLQAQGVIAAWEYESHTFWFEAIKRGTRSYTPDFKVTFPDGQYQWHEVKGWMDPKSKTKLTRMAKYYPNEAIVVVGQDWFRAVVRSGLTGAIPYWERGR